MPPSTLLLQDRRWSLLGVCAAVFALLMLLVSVDGNGVDTGDRLLELRFEAAVSKTTRATQQQVAAYDALLEGLALHFNYLGEGTEERFVAELVERQLPAQFPALTRSGYMTLDAAGRLSAREFEPDTEAVEKPAVLARLPLTALERPLSYSRDFNTLALSAVLPGTGSDSPGENAGQKREVMLVKPVYDNTTVGVSRSSRRLHHRGWIYAMIDTQAMLADVGNSELGPLDVSIYDGLSRQSEKTLLFGSHRDVQAVSAHGLQSIRPVGLASRAWTQVVRLDQGDALPDAQPAGNRWVPRLLLALMIGSALWWMKALWERHQGLRDDTRAF